MKILVSVAGFPYAKQTFEVGCLLARLYKASITVLTVVEEKSEKQAVKEAIKQLAIGYEDVVQAVKVKKGTAVSKIIRECVTGEYDMLVLGTRTVHGISLAKSSKVARQVSKRVSIPLLVVKQKVTMFRRLLVCTAATQKSHTIVETSVHLAQLAQAEIQLLYVADPIPQMYAGLDEMEETEQELLNSGTPVAHQLQRAITLMKKENISGKVRVRHGLVIDEILHEVEDNGYDLILVGAPRHHTVWQILALGNISPHIIENAPCSVMVVRT
jgi:nucleotide-binding universal stress UspA family protein